jgi:Do/DeqQ family serine protease
MPATRITSAPAVLAIFLALLAAAAAPATAQRRASPESREQVQLSFAPIVKRATPAVVNVYVRGRPQQAQRPQLPIDDPVFRRFFGEMFGMPEERAQSSLGSGVIVSPDGLVVTNTHVVKIGGQAEIRIVLADKREFDAKVITQDEKTDIAVLRIAGAEGKLPFLEFEDSDTLEVGDLVLAIGNPFGVGQTVTQGIVSALARSEIGKSEASVFIQTDAAINPGNSGGALVDMAGRLVGINTAIYSRSGGSHGIGFAIPSNLVRLFAESAQSGRKVERPWLGAKLDPVTREIAAGLGLDRATGAVVTRVFAASPAAEARLEPGDVIVAVDGFEVADPRAVLYRMTTRGVGTRTRLEILRQGKRLPVEIALRPVPQGNPADIRNLAGQHPLDGTRVTSVSPAIADELNLDDDKGVVIVQVRNGSIAARLGFRPGDVVLTVGDDTIDALTTLEQSLRQRRRLWQMTVKRAGKVIPLQFQG